MDLKEALLKSELGWTTLPSSLTYPEYCQVMQIAVPHGPGEPCTCKGCGSCKGAQYGCTCDIDWDLARDIRDLWYQ